MTVRTFGEATRARGTFPDRVDAAQDVYDDFKRRVPEAEQIVVQWTGTGADVHVFTVQLNMPNGYVNKSRLHT